MQIIARISTEPARSAHHALAFNLADLPTDRLEDVPALAAQIGTSNPPEMRTMGRSGSALLQYTCV